MVAVRVGDGLAAEHDAQADVDAEIGKADLLVGSVTSGVVAQERFAPGQQRRRQARAEAGASQEGVRIATDHS